MTMGKSAKSEEESCPVCGAVRSSQKFKKRRNQLVDLNKLSVIDFVHPVDGVVCPECGLGFRVSKLEVSNGTYIDLTTEYEFSPKYCPNCRAEIIDDDN